MNTKSMRRTAIGIFALASAFAAADTVQVTVNGNPINFPDSQPQMVNGRVLVPLRGVFEALGATVIWDESSQSISADSSNRHVKLRIGDLEANVNGKVVDMDTAPMIDGGSTLVPLRFLSQSLGASVDWEPQQNLVAVTMRSDRGHAEHFGDPVPLAPPIPADRGWGGNQPNPDPSSYVLQRYNVIPLRLDQTISSDGNKDGDKFTATVRGDQEGYLQLPRGTMIQGVIRRAREARGDDPGQLDVRFTNILLPDGARYPIFGTVAPLNDSNIVRTGNGRFMAKNNDDVNNNVGRDAAIGAGAGLVLGSLHARALGGAAIGGVLGAIVGALTPDHHDRNVRIDQGTRLGLILSHDLSIPSQDLR
jgi:hypothetical protein